MARGQRTHVCRFAGYIELPRDGENTTVLSCEECGLGWAFALRLQPVSTNRKTTFILESAWNGHEPSERAAQRAALLPARPRRHALLGDRLKAGGRPRGESDVGCD